jgi:hypothetical protein
MSANLIHCDDISIEPAPTSPLTFPHQQTGIADFGFSSFYISCGASVANYNPRALTVSITVANRCPKHSVASATLASVLTLPPSTMLGHVMPSFPHTLIGWGPFANQGCKVVFDKTSVFTYLLGILKKLHGVQCNMAGNKFRAWTLNGTTLPTAAASVCQAIYLHCFSNTSIHTPPNHGYLHINVSLLPPVPSRTSRLRC